MAIYRAITDSEIDAYSPATARLFRKLRYQQYGCKSYTLQGQAEATSTGGMLSTDLTTTVGSLQIYVPAWCVGESGTKLKIYAKISRAVIGTGTGTVHVRLKYGTTYSNEESSTSAVGEYKTFNMTITPTANAVASVDVEMYVSGTASTITGYFVWDRDHAASYLEAYE